MMASDTQMASRLVSQPDSMPVHFGIHSEKRAMARAENSTIAPCAKLNTPEALKISTKPMAISAYSVPTMRPPNSVSRKNPMMTSQFSIVLRDTHIA